MKIFKFGGHEVPFSDILNIRVSYKYHDAEIYVDLEVQGGGIISLNLPDSLAFMEEFIHKIREDKQIS